MNRVELRHIPLRPAARFTGWLATMHRLLLGSFLLADALVWSRLWLPHPVFGQAQWPEAVLLLLATATTLASLTQQLPGQNVMAVAFLLAVGAGAVECLGVLTGMPFGPLTYNRQIGQELFYPLPWAVPLIWLVAVLNSRGVARLILRPCRLNPSYGYWLLGLAVALTLLFDLALEPFATQVQHYWAWKPTRIPSDWYSTPWVNFLGWAVSTALMLVFSTPFLLNKSPVKPPPAYHPLAIWVLLNLLFLTGLAVRRLWIGVGVIGGQTLLVVVLALLGARNPKSESRRPTGEDRLARRPLSQAD